MMRGLWLWLWENKGKIVQVILVLMLLLTQSSIWNTVGSVGSDLARLKEINAVLVRTVESQASVVREQGELISVLSREIQRLSEENRRLMECLSRPLPWPGGRLCPPQN